jgi:hypothetical protein
MNNLNSSIQKALVVCALFDISCATINQLALPMFPHIIGQVRARVIYLNVNQTHFVDVRFTFRRIIKVIDIFSA